MREEAQRRIEQAHRDAEAATLSLTSGIHYLAAFCAHQAVEKALKGHHIERLRAMSPKTHDLLLLGRALSVPPEVEHDLRLLNPHYAISRDPDAANGIPAQQYDAAIAAPLLESMARVLAWLT